MSFSGKRQTVKNWGEDQLPNLAGRRYLITGGNSGIGLEAAKMLAVADADVIIACRDTGKATAAVEALSGLGAGEIDSVTLDLASLDSVRTAAAEVSERYSSLDGLVNNAGIMQTPRRSTADGFELQLGTNHLGHFLFAGLLYPLVKAAQGRITAVSSIAHKAGRMSFDDLMLDNGYTPTKAYTQSKLANMLFGLELARRLESAGSPVMANVCHPGYSATNLQSTGPEGVLNRIYKVLNTVAAQSAYRGALPTVLAVAGDEARAGEYYGPTGLGDTRGPVRNSAIARHARNETDARKLWQLSEELVDFQWVL